jgi:23S rRNA (guanosine2251-2'-O)-methyltransferase
MHQQQKKRNDLLTGYRPLKEALDAGQSIRKVLIQQGKPAENIRDLMKILRDISIPYQLVPKEKLDSITKSTHQGIIAFISPIEFVDIENFLPQLYESSLTPLILIMDSITDTRNFGAILRSAEFFGIQAVVIPLHHTADLNEFTSKSSSGAIFKIPICRSKSLDDTCRYLKQSGLQLVAATEKGTTQLPDIDFSLPTAIILGAEDTGISNELIRASDYLVTVNGSGTVESLNVSVAAGIFLYEASKQRT